MSTFHFFMRRAGAVTLHANRISIGAQQLRALAAMRLVTSGATLLERRLVQNPLVLLIRLIHVAVQTNVNGVGLREPWSFASVRIVAVGAIALGTGMLKLRFFDFVALIGVTADAEVFDLRLSQDDFAVLCRLVADIAQFLAKRWMQESLHQLGLSGLVRVVTTHAIGFREGLTFVGLDEPGIAGIVAIQTQGG